MKNKMVPKFIACLLAACFWAAACNRPMLQPPATTTAPEPYQTDTPSTPAGTQPGNTLAVEQATTAPQTEAASTRTPANTPTLEVPTHTTHQLTATPNPTPAWCPVAPAATAAPGKLRIAYARQGDLWLWDEGGSAAQLTHSGKVGLVSISKDGKILVYSRQLDEHHAELWAINSDGSHDRRLLSADDLTQLDGSTDALGVLPTMLQWEPGSHRLSFYTYPLYDALWIYEPSTPMVIDVETGKVSAAPYQGGKIQYSPDRKYVLIFNTSGLSLAKIDGSDRQENILPGYHGIGQGESYYDPYPFWSSDSSSVMVALPDQDELYSPDSSVSIWQIPLSGEAKALGQWKAFAPSVQISPDQRFMIYYPLPEGTSNQRELHLTRIDGNPGKASMDRIYTNGALIDNLAWSPDSQHFLFSMGNLSKNTWLFYTGALCQAASLISETGSSGTAVWLDATRFLLELSTPNDSNHWELLLGKIGQTQPDSLGVVSAYDWAIMP